MRSSDVIVDIQDPSVGLSVEDDFYLEDSDEGIDDLQNPALIDAMFDAKPTSEMEKQINKARAKGFFAAAGTVWSIGWAGEANLAFFGVLSAAIGAAAAYGKGFSKEQELLEADFDAKESQARRQQITSLREHIAERARSIDVEADKGIDELKRFAEVKDTISLPPPPLASASKQEREAYNTIRRSTVRHLTMEADRKKAALSKQEREQLAAAFYKKIDKLRPKNPATKTTLTADSAPQGEQKIETPSSKNKKAEKNNNKSIAWRAIESGVGLGSLVFSGLDLVASIPAVRSFAPPLAKVVSYSIPTMFAGWWGYKQGKEKVEELKIARDEKQAKIMDLQTLTALNKELKQSQKRLMKIKKINKVIKYKVNRVFSNHHVQVVSTQDVLLPEINSISAATEVSPTRLIQSPSSSKSKRVSSGSAKKPVVTSVLPGQAGSSSSNFFTTAKKVEAQKTNSSVERKFT